MISFWLQPWLTNNDKLLTHLYLSLSLLKKEAYESIELL